ncbi:MAG: DNA recombination protein RmuC [bacterium]
MDTIILIALGILLITMLAGLILFTRRLNNFETKDKNDTSFVMLNQNIQSLQSRLDSQIGESTKIIQNVTEKLTKLDETNKQVLNFSGQLQNLQDLLKNPKQRGAVGEYYLETVLKNVLPPGSYELQYRFKDGEIVDAIVRVKEKIIPIDAKFSLDNYNRLVETTDPQEKERLEKAFVNDLKLRIQETAKYIRPGEGTLEFAFMFIPSEAIYYDLLTNKVGAVKENTENLIQRAGGKYRVIIVSPTSFLAYLQTVLQGLRALQIEESAIEIKKNVEALGRHLRIYHEHHTKVGNHLQTTQNAYQAADGEFKKINKDIIRIAKTDNTSKLDKPDSN